MRMYRIQIVNHSFRQSNDGEHASQEAAIKAAMRGALQIGTDEICHGASFFGADVTIALDGEILERRMVAIGSTPLQSPTLANA